MRLWAPLLLVLVICGCTAAEPRAAAPEAAAPKAAHLPAALPALRRRPQSPEEKAAIAKHGPLIACADLTEATATWLNASDPPSLQAEEAWRNHPPIPHMESIIRLQSGGIRACYQDAVLSLPSLAGKATFSFDVDESGGIRACYRNPTRSSPDLVGQATVSFVIDEQGTVRHVGLANYTLPDCQMAACLLREFKGMHFPVPPGGAVAIQYPLSFDAPGQTCGPAEPPERIGATKGYTDSQVVQRTVRTKFSDLRLCLEAGLTRRKRGDQALDAKIWVRFTIQTDGTVSNASVTQSTMPDGEVDECMRRVYESLHFPPPTSGPVTQTDQIRMMVRPP